MRNRRPPRSSCLFEPPAVLAIFAVIVAVSNGLNAWTTDSTTHGLVAVLAAVALVFILLESWRPGCHWYIAGGAMAGAKTLEWANDPGVVGAVVLCLLLCVVYLYVRNRPGLFAYYRDFQCPLVYMIARLDGPAARHHGLRRRRSTIDNTHPWNRYFNRPLKRHVSSLFEAARFLTGCKYLSDRRSRSRDDHWEPPDEFEQRRRGDCDDHAVWAWRVLTDLGYQARLVLGQLLGESHAWVQIEVNGRAYLVEPTSKYKSWPSVQGYEPQWSVLRVAPEGFAFFQHLQQDESHDDRRSPQPV